METKSLYLVQDGEAVRVRGPVPVDGMESILALATDEAHALELARRYDAGEIQPDNVTLPDGMVVGALISCQD
jgi:hypothetical protein